VFFRSIGQPVEHDVTTYADGSKTCATPLLDASSNVIWFFSRTKSLKLKTTQNIGGNCDWKFLSHISEVLFASSPANSLFLGHHSELVANSKTTKTSPSPQCPPKAPSRIMNSKQRGRGGGRRWGVQLRHTKRGGGGCLHGDWVESVRVTWFLLKPGRRGSGLRIQPMLWRPMAAAWVEPNKWKPWRQLRDYATGTPTLLRSVSCFSFTLNLNRVQLNEWCFV